MLIKHKLHYVIYCFNLVQFLISVIIVINTFLDPRDKLFHVIMYECFSLAFFWWREICFGVWRLEFSTNYHYSSL